MHVEGMRWAHNNSWVAAHIASTHTMACPQLLVWSTSGQLLTQVQHGASNLMAWAICAGSRSMLAVTASGPAERCLSLSHVPNLSLQQAASSRPLPEAMHGAEHLALSADASLVVALAVTEQSCQALFACTDTCSLLHATQLPGAEPCFCNAMRWTREAGHCMVLGPFSLAVTLSLRGLGALSFCTVLVNAHPGEDLGRMIIGFDHTLHASKAYSPCGAFLALMYGCIIRLMDTRSGEIIWHWSQLAVCSVRFCRMFSSPSPRVRVQWGRGGWQLRLAANRGCCGGVGSNLLAVVQFYHPLVH